MFSCRILTTVYLVFASVLIQSTNQNPSRQAKTCNLAKKIEKSSDCEINGYRERTRTRDAEECMDKCGQTEWCEHAIFIESEEAKSGGPKAGLMVSFGNPSDKADSSKGKTSDSGGLESDFYSESSTEKPKGLSRKTRSVTDSDGCYLFKKFDNLHCQDSEKDFAYNYVACYSGTGRPKCKCGKCGESCEELNYRRVPDACMSDHYFGHKAVTTVEDCIKFCIDTPGCKSIDYGSIDTCLINAVNRTDRTIQYGCDGKNEEKFDYYELICDNECQNEKPRPPPMQDICTNAPKICKHGGVCKTVQLPQPEQTFTYECDCPCNFCGRHCERLNVKTYKNACLKYGVPAWTVAHTAKDCLVLCNANSYCTGVSYCDTSGTCVFHWANTTEGVLTPSSKCPSYQIRIQEAEWSYYQFLCTRSCKDEVEVVEGSVNEGCTSGPCLNGGTCADAFNEGKTIGYLCTCPCGFCGKNCEKLHYTKTEKACIWGSHVSTAPEDYYKSNTTAEECIRLCALRHPVCKSVDFSSEGDCYLNLKSSRQVEPAYNCNNYQRRNWDLYELRCDCNHDHL